MRTHILYLIEILAIETTYVNLYPISLLLGTGKRYIYVKTALSRRFIFTRELDRTYVGGTTNQIRNG